MSKKETTVSSDGLGLCGVLFIIFLVLKLTGNIDWSWWWVCAPLWIPLAIAVVLFAIVFIVFLVAAIFSGDKDK